MNVMDIRIENLERIIDANGGNAAAGKKFGIDPTYISQLRNRHRSFGEKAARNIEEKMGLTPNSFDWPGGVPQFINEIGPTISDRFDFVGSDKVEFEYASKVSGKLSAGSGHLSFEHEEKYQSHAFQKSWLKKKGIKDASRLKIFTVEGDSMVPKLEDGSVVGVHLDDRTIRSNKIYAFMVDDELRIKRFNKRSDGALEIISDNPRYEKEVIAAEAVARLNIIGRMVWYSGED